MDEIIGHAIAPIVIALLYLQRVYGDMITSFTTGALGASA